MPSKLILLLAALSTATTVRAGVVIHIAARDVSTGKAADHQVYYAQNGLLRIDTLDDQGHVKDVLLIRDGALWQIDIGQRTYRKLDKAAMQAKTSALDARMQAMLAQMPPERRAKMEQRLQQMKTRQTDEYSWTDTGRTEKAGAYDCHTWQLQRNGKSDDEENCLVPAASLGGNELTEALKNATAIGTEVISGNPRAAKIMSERMTVLNHGFPVLTRHLSGGKVYREELVTAVEHSSLPADKFTVPKDFTAAAERQED